MPSNQMLADMNFPDLSREDSTDEKFRAVQDYLFLLLEQLRYVLNNLTMENMNQKELKSFTDSLTEPLRLQMAGLTIDISQDGNTMTYTLGSNGLQISSTKCIELYSLNGSLPPVGLAGGVIVNSGAGISETLAVSGVFAPVASTGSFGVELQDGATLDLSAWTGDLPFTGVAFASGAVITVNLAGRADLRKVAKSENPYVVTWAAQPDATFALDLATASRCKVNAEDSGLRIEFVDGFVLFIR